MVLASRSTGMRRAGAFLALVAFEVVAVVVLHRLGELSWLRIPFDDLEGWLQTSAPEDVLAAVVRLIALGAAWWLLGSTALYALARISRIPGAVRAVEWFTLPSVRRLADQALALTLATSIVSGGANAALANPTGLIPTPPAAVVTVHDPLATWTRVSTFGYRPTATTPDDPIYQPEPAGGPSPAAGTRGPDGGRPSYHPEAAGEVGTGDAGDGSVDAGDAGIRGGIASGEQAPGTNATTTTGSSPSTSGTSQPPTTASPTSTPPTTGPPTTAPRSTVPPSTVPPSTVPPSTKAPVPGKPPAVAYVPRPAGPAPSTTRPPTPVRPGYTPAPAGRPPGQSGPTDRADTGLHRVAEGDNLWTIARDHLARVTRRRASDLSEREIARYWLDVVDANRAGLRSGDPDVIFPGETVKLPPVTTRREP
jgi:hypothetical protein